MMRKFDPYFDKAHYYKGLRNGKKLLIVGDSHYDSAYSRDLTCRVVNEWAIKNTHRFFETIRRISGGLDEEVGGLSRERFWERIAFCNLVQDIMPESSSVPDKRQFVHGWEALKENIAQLEPDLMFVFSARAWEYTGNELCSEDGVPASGPFQNGVAGFWRYERLQKPPLLAARFNHPRMLGASMDVWRVWAEYIWQSAAAQ